MSRIEIECDDPVKKTCECCGGTSTTLTRFVYKDGDAFAIYFALFSDNHPEREMSVAVSIGEWGDGTTAEDRLAFALILRCREDQYEVMVVNADKSPWQDAEMIGRMLDRDEALAHPWIEEVFHITDHMVEDDLEIRSYFENEQRVFN